MSDGVGDLRAAHFVQSLERGLAVIRAFGAEHPELTLSEVSRATGLTRAATRRFLLTLADLGYVRSDGRLFALTPRVLELGYAFLSIAVAARGRRAAPGAPGRRGARVLLGERARRRRHRLRRPRADRADHARRRSTSARASPPTRRRWAACCSPAMTPDDLDAYLGRVELRRLSPRTIDLGARCCAPSSTRVRAQGWSMVDQELEEGLRSVAAPIRDRVGPRDRGGQPVGAHASRTSAEADAPRAAAAAAGDGGADRGRPAHRGQHRALGLVIVDAAPRAGAATIASIILLAHQPAHGAREPAAARARRARRARAVGDRGRACSRRCRCCAGRVRAAGAAAGRGASRSSACSSRAAGRHRGRDGAARRRRRPPALVRQRARRRRRRSRSRRRCCRCSCAPATRDAVGRADRHVLDGAPARRDAGGAALAVPLENALGGWARVAGRSGRCPPPRPRSCGRWRAGPGR